MDAMPPMLNCSQAMAELDSYLRGELTVEVFEQVRAHLERCQHCRQVGEFERAFRARLEQLDAGRACPEPLRARILELLTPDHGADTP